jgi:hypothetical protein
MKLELLARGLHPEAVSEILTIVEAGQVDRFIAEDEDPVAMFLESALVTTEPS